MIPIRCAGVLLDLDGVLVDSAAAVERSWRAWARRTGLDEAVVLAACHGRPSAETIRLVAPGLDAAAEAVRLERGQAADTAGLAACPGAAELLAGLPPDRWAVVTSGSRPLATARLRGAGLPVPAVLVSADDTARGKPAPDGYRAGAAGLGLAPGTCVAVEDARPGVLAARAAGCGVVVGVAGPLLGPADGPDLVVGDLTELVLSVAPVPADA